MFHDAPFPCVAAFRRSGGPIASWRALQPLRLKGKREPPRAYSMCSSPHERYLAVTVKEERYLSGTTKFPPLLSPLLRSETSTTSKYCTSSCQTGTSTGW